MGASEAAPFRLALPARPSSAATEAPRAALLAQLTESLRSEVSPTQLQELLALGKENDSLIFWADLLHYAGQLEKAEKSQAAAYVYASIAGAETSSSIENVDSPKYAAKARLDAIQGKGAFGGRAEVLLGRFTQEACDPKVILPMLAGSAVYSLAKTATLGRLATTTRAAWYSRGLGANLAAASVGFAAEVPTFVLSSRGLRNLGGSGPEKNPSLGEEFASAAITLGMLKTFAFAGNQAFLKFHGFNGSPIYQFTFSQSAMFGGLLTAHMAEEALGLRTHVDGATTVTDTLASMFSMGVGAHLGHKILGSRFASFQRELEIGAQSAAQKNGTPKSFAGPIAALAAGSEITKLKVSERFPDRMLMSISDGEGPEGPGRSGPRGDIRLGEEVPIEGIMELQAAVRRGDLSKLETLGKAAVNNDIAVNVLANFAEKGNLHALRALAEAGKRNPSATDALNELSESGPLAVNALAMLIEGKKDYFPHLLRLDKSEAIYRILATGHYKTENFQIVHIDAARPWTHALAEGTAALTTVLGSLTAWLHGSPFVSLPVGAIALGGGAFTLALHLRNSRLLRQHSLRAEESLAFSILATSDWNRLHFFPLLQTLGLTSPGDARAMMIRVLDALVEKEDSLLVAAKGKTPDLIRTLEHGARLDHRKSGTLRDIAKLGNPHAKVSLEKLRQESLQNLKRYFGMQQLRFLRLSPKISRKTPSGGGPLLAIGIGLASLLHTERAEAAIPDTVAVRSENRNTDALPYATLLMLGMGILGGKGDRPEPSTPEERLRQLKIDLAPKNKIKARRKSLDELNQHLMVTEQNDPSLPEAAETLRELFYDGDPVLAGAAMDYYGTLILCGFQVGNAEIRKGVRELEKIRDDANLDATLRKSANLAMTYIEGGMELNGTADFRQLEGTLTLPTAVPTWRPNIEGINALLLPLKLRKLFTDPNTNPNTANQILLRYVAVVHGLNNDLRFEGEMRELLKVFRIEDSSATSAPWLPKSYRISLETPTEKAAAKAFISLTRKYRPGDLSVYGALQTLREMFAHDKLAEDPNLVHDAFQAYVQGLSPELLERRPDWWQKELQSLKEPVEEILQNAIAKAPSPWVRNSSDWRPPLGGPNDLLILEAYAELLRPLPTTHPALADGMRTLNLLARRRSGAEAMRTNFVADLANRIRAEKVASLPPPSFHAQGWGVDLKSGKPIYIDRALDTQIYRITETRGEGGTTLTIQGPDLNLTMRKEEGGGGLLGGNTP